MRRVRTILPSTEYRETAPLMIYAQTQGTSSAPVRVVAPLLVRLSVWRTASSLASVQQRHNLNPKFTSRNYMGWSKPTASSITATPTTPPGHEACGPAQFLAICRVADDGLLTPCADFLVWACARLAAGGLDVPILYDADGGDIWEHECSQSTPPEKEFEKTQEHVKCGDVHFSYAPRQGIKLLRGLSFEAKPGEHVALVGTFGSWKSTITLNGFTKRACWTELPSIRSPSQSDDFGTAAADAERWGDEFMDCETTRLDWRINPFLPALKERQTGDASNLHAQTPLSSHHHLMASFGTTISSGIQDISAILSLFGTEQCEFHIGSALRGGGRGGYMYAAITPVSIFGSPWCSGYIPSPAPTYIRMPGTLSECAGREQKGGTFHFGNVPGLALTILGIDTCPFFDLFSSSHYHHSWPNKPTNASKARQKENDAVKGKGSSSGRGTSTPLLSASSSGCVKSALIKDAQSPPLPMLSTNLPGVGTALVDQPDTAIVPEFYLPHQVTQPMVDSSANTAFDDQQFPRTLAFNRLSMLNMTSIC
ncbi:hypothetical protein B0H13DRAFT_2265913 [Mycena leptocephala]|nr:hypothetical protein B0H13DRAFT_2265913 [Mycena leptocephala]